MATSKVKRNRWKIAFWVCTVFLIIIVLFSSYGIIDQAITITYMREGYSDTKEDLKTLTQIINETKLKKGEIVEFLKKHDSFQFIDFSKDSVRLNGVMLHFEDDRLIKAEIQ